MKKVLEKEYVEELLVGLVKINAPQDFGTAVAQAFGAFEPSDWFGESITKKLEFISSSLGNILNDGSIPTIKAYAAAQALYSPGGLLGDLTFGKDMLYANQPFNTLALCLDASGIRVSDTLKSESKRVFVLNCLKSKAGWKKFNSDASMIKQHFGVSGMDDYFQEILESAQNHLKPMDAKEFPEAGCLEFLQGRAMNPHRVFAKLMFGIESSTLAITTFRRLIRVLDSLAHDLHAAGVLTRPQLTESMEKIMAGVLSMRASKTGQNWTKQDDEFLLKMTGHVRSELPLKSIISLARALPLSQTSLSEIDLVEAHGASKLKKAVSQYAHPGEITGIIENAGISSAFTPSELRRFRGNKLEADLGM